MLNDENSYFVFIILYSSASKYRIYLHNNVIFVHANDCPTLSLIFNFEKRHTFQYEFIGFLHGWAAVYE